MANIIINRTVSLDGPILPESMGAPLYQQENNAHQFVIQCKRGGNNLTLSGSVQGRMIRADGNTVVITGSVSDGKAVVTLPQSAYAVRGRFAFAVINVDSGATTVIYTATGNIGYTSTGQSIDPGTVVPDITLLLAQIDAMQQATAAANAAATGALANFAGSFSAATAYPAGTYVTYTDGFMYVLPDGHEADVTWANTTKNKVTTGKEISDLKSALPSLNYADCPAFGNGDDLNDLTSYGAYRITSASIATSLLNKPTGLSGGGRLFVLTSTANNRLVQILISSVNTPCVWIRSNTGTWQDWIQIANTNEIKALSDALSGEWKEYAVNSGKYVTANGVETNTLLSCSNYIEIPDNVDTVYMYSLVTANGALTPINPACVMYDSSKAVINTVKASSASEAYLTIPLGNNIKYIRFNVSQVADDQANVVVKFMYFGRKNTDYVGSYTFSMTSENKYDTEPLFTLKANKTYKIICLNATEDIKRCRFLMSSGNVVYADINKQRPETIIKPTQDTFLRAYNIENYESLTMSVSVYEYGDHDVDTEKRVYYVLKGNSLGAHAYYESITQCLLDLKDDRREKTIYIEGGNYDIYQEYVNANVPVYTGNEPTYQYFDYCVWVPENTHIVGLGLVRLIWNPDKEDVTTAQCQTVSPLNVAASCTIENIEVHCKNGRYALHNDGLGKLEFAGAIQKYINCRFYKHEPDQDGNGIYYGKSHTIGFGIDAEQRLEFINCEFHNDFYEDSSHYGLAFYGHTRANTNGVAVDEKTSGNIIVRDCVIKSLYDICARLDNSLNGNIHIRTTFAGCYFSGRISVPIADTPNAYDITILNCNGATVSTANDKYPVNYYPPIN